MPDWPLTGDGQRWDTQGWLATGTEGTAIVAPATANTKPATYTTLHASTPFDASGFLFQIVKQVGASRYFIDIARGAATAERAMVENLIYAGPNANLGGFSQFFPVSIPAGTRISARVQSSSASASVACVVSVYGGSFVTPSPAGIVTTYGIDATSTLNTSATLVDPGSTAGTKGSWITLPPTIMRDTSQIMIAASGKGAATQQTARWRLDLGIGATPTIILPDISLTSGYANYVVLGQRYIGPIPMHIPAGVALKARVQNIITSLPDRAIEVAVYGIS